MISAAEVSGLNSAVTLMEAECDRLPAPYGNLLKNGLGIVLPLAVAFIVKKFGAPAAPAVAAPAASAPAAG